MKEFYDVIILGSGLGGGTMAYALSNTGAKILLVERGDFIPAEPENWDGKAVFQQNRYATIETWNQHQLRQFYCVGGSSKVYGAALHRLRREDFGELVHSEGVSPAWPISYEEMEPYYARAEELYGVHGDSNSDPTEPPHSKAYPFPPLSHERTVERLGNRLRGQGLSPYKLPMAVDLRTSGKCIRCATCDGFPCKLLAKGDSDGCCVRPALERSNVDIMTNSFARRLITNTKGDRVNLVEIERGGERFLVAADTFIVSCGALNSALLLLRSRCETHPQGLANLSGQAGRNFMTHNGGVVLSFDLWHANRDLFQKTLGVNDFYFQGPNWEYPMGNVQTWGTMSPYLFKVMAPHMPMWKIRAILSRTVALLVLSEDLPDPENRVFLDASGNPCLNWKPNNLNALNKLLSTMKSVLENAGYTRVVAATAYEREMKVIPQVTHQMGTLRFGNDPHTSVLNPYCQTHDVPNLFVADGSFFPSSGAVNPGLTIIAQSLRVADYIMKNHKLGERKT